MAVIVNILITLVVAAVVLLIVSRLNLGLSVAGFGPAIIAAAVIAIVAGLIAWLLSLLNISLGTGTGLWPAIVNLIVAAVVLLLSGRLFQGLKVNGFGGAIIGAIAIAVVTWLIIWVLGLFGITGITL